ncbi:MAG: hypothetical protein AMXMBFR23_25230 [Chloroflexota bacterium]
MISDAHRGLVVAIRETLLGAAWQHCRVHFTRNAQGLVPRGAAGMVTSAIRSIFEQLDESSASAQLRRVADGLSARFPAVAELLTDAEPDLLVHFTFSEAHRRQIRSTSPLERLNKEIERRTAVAGIFPTRASLIRLVGMVLFEQDDEWQDGPALLQPRVDGPGRRASRSRGGRHGTAHRQLIAPTRGERCYTTFRDLTTPRASTQSCLTSPRPSAACHVPTERAGHRATAHPCAASR